MSRIKEALSLDVLDSENFNKKYLPETSAAAFSRGCALLSSNSKYANTLFDALKSDSVLYSRAQTVVGSLESKKPYISEDTAKRLYGSNIHLSASRFDVFNRCKFQYFCKYGLKAKKLQPADFDVLQRGTLIHYILERLITEYSAEVQFLKDEQISDAVDRYISDYLSAVKGYASVHNARLQFLIDNISRSVKEVARQLRDEFLQSDFEPKYCEFSFGNGERASVDVEFDGGKILLGGSIDRVDQWNGYIRIVDYKSGSRSFRLPDILVGQNMQMLLYLYSVFKMSEFAGSEPAGIFYMPSKRDKNENGLAMNGLMVADEELVFAMDKENGGRYIPRYVLTASGELNKNYASSFVEKRDFDTIFNYIERLLKRTGEALLSGNIDIDPVDGLDSPACKYCDFANICEIGDTACPKAEKLTNREVVDEIAKGEI